MSQPQQFVYYGGLHSGFGTHEEQYRYVGNEAFNSTFQMSSSLGNTPLYHREESRTRPSRPRNSSVYGSEGHIYGQRNAWDATSTEPRSQRWMGSTHASTRQAPVPSSVVPQYRELTYDSQLTSTGYPFVANSGQAMLGAGSLATASTDTGSYLARFASLPYHKQTLISGMRRGSQNAQFFEPAVELLEYCNKAEQENTTLELPSSLTDKFLAPVTRPLTAKGIGSRRGLESYRCLWPNCSSKASRKANAVSHLLSHVQYKPFVCNDW